MKKVLLIIMLCMLSGCGYIFPDATSIKPATTTLDERKEKIDPPARTETIKETIKITRGKGAK